jgi:hypothetical protein
MDRLYLLANRAGSSYMFLLLELLLLTVRHCLCAVVVVIVVVVGALQGLSLIIVLAWYL